MYATLFLVKILVGTELILFIYLFISIEAYAMLCFGFFDENRGDNALMLLVVEEQHLHRAKDFSSLPRKKLGVHKELGWDAARTGDHNDQRDVPYCLVSYSAIKAGEKKEEEGGCLV